MEAKIPQQIKMDNMRDELRKRIKGVQGDTRSRPPRPRPPRLDLTNLTPTGTSEHRPQTPPTPDVTPEAATTPEIPYPGPSSNTAEPPSPSKFPDPPVFDETEHRPQTPPTPDVTPEAEQLRSQQEAAKKIQRVMRGQRAREQLRTQQKAQKIFNV